MLGLALQLFVLLPGMSYQLFCQSGGSRADMALIADRIRSSDRPINGRRGSGADGSGWATVALSAVRTDAAMRGQKGSNSATCRHRAPGTLITIFPGLLDRDRWSDECWRRRPSLHAAEEIGYTVVTARNKLINKL